MKQLSAVKVNGSIYVAGEIISTENYSSNFWCYNPIGDEWTEKPHTCVETGEIVLRKFNQSIFICNHFMVYDVASNRWKKVMLPIAMTKCFTHLSLSCCLLQLDHGDLSYDDMFECKLHDAIEFDGTCYGVCAIEDALSFKILDFEGSFCSIEDVYEWDSSDMYGTESHFFVH